MEKKNITIEEDFKFAWHNHQKNNLDVAKKFYKKVLSINSNHFRSIYLLGELLIQTKNFNEAKQVLNKGLKINPNHAETHNNLGLVFQELGEPQKAISHCQRAIEIQPDFVHAHNNLGLVFMVLREHKKAISCFQKAIKINPNFTNPHNNLGIVFQVLGEPLKAISSYQNVIEIQPDFVHAHNNLGLAFKEIGEREKAVSCFQKAIKINPSFSNTYFNLGTVLEELNQPEKAISCYKKTLKLSPNSVDTQANISNIYIKKLDNLEKAINESYKALRMHHNTSEFKNQKISLYRLKHDVQQAEYLSSKNYEINGIEEFQKIGNKILNREENRKNDNNLNQKILLNHDEIKSLLPYYKSNYIYQTPKISGSYINPHKNWREVEKQYFNSPKQIIHIDNFLSDEAIKELREFCLVSKIWNREYPNKYLGALSDKGFISPIHLQIAIQLQQKLPKLFGKHDLGKFWGFKYDSTLGKGIGIHADFALINLNFWITPDEYNNNKNSGGLKVYDVLTPVDWTFRQYNRNHDKIYKFLNDNNANCTNIPYKFNRAVLFNSAYFHETDEINFKEGYETRRINITYLFGTRLIKKIY